MIEIPTRPDWAEHAACKGVDPDLFFPERGTSVEAAQAVCGACPVRLACLEEAITRPEKFGIWGGLSERQRRHVRRARRQLREAS